MRTRALVTTPPQAYATCIIEVSVADNGMISMRRANGGGYSPAFLTASDARELAAMLIEAAGPEPVAPNKPPSRSGARWLADHPEGRAQPASLPDAPVEHDRSGEIDPVARQDLICERCNRPKLPLVAGYLPAQSCWCDGADAKDREIERLMTQVTELQIANTREVEARRAAERNWQIVAGKFEECAENWRAEKVRADAAENERDEMKNELRRVRDVIIKVEIELTRARPRSRPGI